MSLNPNDMIDETGQKPDNLRIILETRQKLKLAKSNDIIFSSPVIKHNDDAVIFPHTINVIQGQAGVHKSRLAEVFCSALMKTHSCKNNLLGLKRVNFDPLHKVVYVDTERNLAEQFPYALQSIQIKAGYKKEDHPLNFDYVSLLEIDRDQRFTALVQFLEHIQKDDSTPLFIVLDVSTDCIEDFNKTDKSMLLIDLMNKAINKHDVVFLCLIHENPKSDKARGHFGTELMNKASTVMQVGFEKDSCNNDTDLVKVKYLKCRSTARHTPFYVKYCNIEKGLVLASDSDISSVINNRKHKAGAEAMIEHLEMYLGDGTKMPRTELLDKLCKDFNASNRTIEARLKEFIQAGPIFNKQGKESELMKENKGKVIYYFLTEVED